MAEHSRTTFTRAAVLEIQLDQLDEGVSGLDGYERALVLYRMGEAVLGQAWLPVHQSRIYPDTFRASLPSLAWTIWAHTLSQEPRPAGPLPTASVVVCTRNRTEDLANCLPGLALLAEQGCEVIVVDSCPTYDTTARLVATYPQIRYIYEPRPGAGIARNRGLLAAAGEVVAFTDDDARVDPGWLKALLHSFDDPMVAAVTGLTMPLELESAAQLWFELTNGFGRGFLRKQFDASTLNPLAAGLVGASVNVAIRRSVLEEVGLFDEALGPGTPSCSGEDHEFFYRLLAHGFRIVYEPDALVWHRHRGDWKSLQQALFGYGVGVFAWWTRALLVEKEWTLLWLGTSWFWQHHVKNYFQALFRRPGSMPLDLARAELRGALAGPTRYRRSRRWLAELALSTQPQTGYKSDAPKNQAFSGRQPAESTLEGSKSLALAQRQPVENKFSGLKSPAREPHSTALLVQNLEAK
jgi:GT2 family glycosyltransferase